MDVPCRTAETGAVSRPAYGARLETSSRRMSRFMGVRPSRNAAGRSLPSDRHVQRVTVCLACAGPAHAGRNRPRVLAGFWTYSWYDAFTPIQVNEEVPNKGLVDRSFITDEAGRASAVPVPVPTRRLLEDAELARRHHRRLARC